MAKDQVLGMFDRRGQRALRRKKDRRLKKLRRRIDKQLHASGVSARVTAIAAAVADPEVGEKINAARREHELTVGPIKDYNVLRQVVETTLSSLGHDLRDVMLKFSWDGKELGIGVFASARAIEAAAEALGIGAEDAFQSMLEGNARAQAAARRPH